MKRPIFQSRAALARRTLLGLTLAATGSLAGAQTTWYVDDDAPGDPGQGFPQLSDPAEDGTLLHPFDDIQEGINAAASGDTVLVLGGIYFTVQTLDLSGVDPGGNPLGVKQLTIRSIEGPATTIIDANILLTQVVQSLQGESAATVLEGFTIRNGNPGMSAGQNGGGLFLSNSSPTIRDCWFTNNAAYVGGAVYMNASASVFEDCEFLNNSAAHQGGAVYTNNGQPTFSRCHFEGNQANFGGAFLSRTTAATGVVVTVSDCVFFQNTALLSYAGALAKFDGGDLLVERTRFLSNVAVGPGGGAYISDGGTVRDCIFNSNTSGNGQGGGCCVIKNLLIEVIGSTFTGNVGGAFFESGVVPGLLRNCIVWGNTPYELSNFVGVNHCDVLGGYVGIGNFDADPLFQDAAGADGMPGTLDDDLSLFMNSPCIDAGDSGQAAFAYPKDFLGNPRVVDNTEITDTGITLVGQSIDMGAYEFQPPPPACMHRQFRRAL